MEIFDAVCDLPAEARESALDAACARDAELRSEVVAMLEADGAGAGVLQRSGIGAEWLAAEVVESTGPLPERLGRYRVIREIGRGGMGVVYEAEQDEPSRRVAVKVIREGIADPDAVRRFRREVQLLGRLQHPGIAHVYESGIDRHGGVARPYFAMEYIEGLPIDRHADEHGLDVHQRVELIVRVCNAVHHAHQKGVLHRDLKAANVLVVAPSDGTKTDQTDSTWIDEIGQPKVMDFGIARLTDEIDDDSARTYVGQILGTISNMSPEQLTADVDSVDVRSDVYAIGVLLYRLLAGRMPHDLAGRSIPEAVRKVAEEDPPTLGSILPALRGDLSVIVQKALDRDPARRYESVAALAEDLRRVLADEPIAARPSSVWYRARKFARRNRGLVASGMALLVVMVAGTVVSTVFGVRAGASLQLATQAAADAERASYLASLSAAAAALRDGDAQLAGQFLDRAPEALRGWEWHYFNGLRDRSVASALFADPPSSNTLSRHVQFVQSRSWLSSATKRLHIVTRRGNLSHFDAFDLPSLELAGSWKGEPGDTCLGLCDEGRRVVLYNADTGRMQIRSLTTGAVMDSRLIGLSQPATSFDLLPWSCDQPEELVRQANLRPGESNAQRFGIYSPDGQFWLWAQELVPRAISTVDPTIIREFGPYTERARGAAFDADGQRLALGTVARVLEVLDFDSAQPLWRVDEAHTDAIMCAAFSPDGELLATGAQDRLIRLWEASSGVSLGQLLGHKHTVAGLVFDQEDGMLYSHDAFEVKAWRIEEAFDPGIEFRHTSFVRDVQFNLEGSLAGFRSRGDLFVYDPATRESRRLAPISSDKKVDTFCFIDNRHIAAILQPRGTTSTEQVSSQLVHLDTITGELLASFELGTMSSSPMHALGHTVMIYDSPLRVVDLETGNIEELDRSPVSTTEENALFGRVLVSNGASLEMRSPDMNLRQRWENFELMVTASTVHEPSSRVFAADAENLHVIDTATGEIIRSLPIIGEIASLAVLPDGSRVFGGYRDSTIRIWDAQTLELVSVLRGHRDSVTSLWITHDGSTLYSGSDDYTIRRWSTRR